MPRCRTLIKDKLNELLIRFIRIRGIYRIFRIFGPSIGVLSRRYDKDISWPDYGFFIDNTPAEIGRSLSGTSNSYTAWIYQQGFFASLIASYAKHESLRIFDFGCGYGNAAPISTFFTHPNGKYFGVDIRPSCIDLCKREYSHLERVEFALSKDFNATYSEDQKASADNEISYGSDWPVTAQSIDIVLSISVFTHLKERDALGYIGRIHDILKPGGLAILTFSIVEEPRRQPRFTSPNKPHVSDIQRFSTPLPPSNNWFTGTPERPEDAIAINSEGLNHLVRGNFEINSIIRGSTTGGYGPYPWDIVVLEKVSL